jgi:hypothetical protein
MNRRQRHEKEKRLKANIHAAKEAKKKAQSDTEEKPNMTQKPAQEQRQRYYENKELKFWIEVTAYAGGLALAILTYMLWSDAHRNFKTDERGWAVINLKGAFPANRSDLVVGAPIEVNADISVGGKTPIHNVDSHWRLDIVNTADAISLKSPTEYESTVGLLQLTDSTSVQIFKFNPGIADSHERFTSEQVKELIDGDAYIAAYGRGTYQDVFNETHWFKYCEWKTYHDGGNYNAKECTNYKKSGDGKLPKD